MQRSAQEFVWEGILEPSTYPRKSWKTSEFLEYHPGNCSSCDFKARNLKSDSTPRDLVISLSCIRLTNIVPLTRTLRQTGCRATFILLVDDLAWDAIDKKLGDLLYSCAVTLLQLPYWRSRDQAAMLRFILIEQFLREHIKFFDRVLIIDLFDAVFQGDPFHKDLPRDMVGISEENVYCDQNQKRIASRFINRRSISRFWHKHNCLNIGLVIGGIKPVLNFLRQFSDFVTKMPVKNVGSIRWADQVIVNILYGLGRLSPANGIKMRIWKEPDEYRTAWMLFGRPNVTYRIGEYRLYAGGHYPLVVHMYDRSKGFRDSVVKACPQEFATKDPYSRFARIKVL
jgi:hypothetical protein